LIHLIKSNAARLNNPVSITIFIAFFFGGAISVFGASIVCITALSFIIFSVYRSKKLHIGFGLPMAASCILLLGYLLSCINAIDEGMALLGFLRMFSVLTFVLLMYQQFDRKGRTDIWDAVPMTGALSVIMAICSVTLSLFTQSLHFFQNGRLGGVFEYANTYALWLLLGMVVIAFKDKPGKSDHLFFALNVCGIFLTLSRSMFILTAGALGLIFLIRKDSRKMIAAMSGAGLLAGILTGILIGAGEWGRLAETPEQAGEWLSRLAYYRDAFPQIIQRPFGIGYLGYWYTQPVWQTAFYETRFVHSSLMQFALDIGVIPSLLIAGLGVFMIIRKKTPLMEKIIMILIFGHSLIDFDLEYLILIFVICLCVKPEKAKAISPRIPAVILSLLIPVFMYVGVAAFSAERWDGALAIRMYPGYTDALEKRMIHAPSLESSADYAKRILERNPYNFVAIDTLARVCYRDGDFELAAILKSKSLEINRMFADDYLEFLEICSAGYERGLAVGNYESAERFRQMIVSIPGRIEAVQNSLHADAYRLKHTPDLELPEFAAQYIENLRLAGA